MSKILSGLRGKTLLFIFLLTVALTQTSCSWLFGKARGVRTNHVSNWVNWNYVFKEGTDSNQRRMTIQQITNQVVSVRSDSTKGNDRPITSRDSFSRPITYSLYAYLRKSIRSDLNFSLDSVRINFCSCHDTLLWNLTADLNIGGSGQSVPNPQPPPAPGAQGEAVGIVDSNASVSSPSSSHSLLDTGRVAFNTPVDVTDKVVLGIIDSGIDPSLFSPDLYSRLFAPDGSGTVNFMSGMPATSGYQDDDPVRHGSAVAAIALNAFYTRSAKAGQPQLPRLMVLKALDSTGKGSTFTVSCALSYAISHHVNLINASLGYRNVQNEVINHYLELSAKYSIPVIAAAGNVPPPHSDPLCSQGINRHNELGSGNLFYPACQSIESKYNIISVTGLSSPNLPCTYQNFSSRYISVGVVNDVPRNSCCGFALPFINHNYVLDGSSFATPVISGELGYEILRNGARNNAPAYLQMLSTSKIMSNLLTWDGQYITY